MSNRKVLEVRLVSLGDGDGIPQRRVLLAAGQDVIVGRASSNRGVAASADNTKISNPVISKEHAVFTLDPAGTFAAQTVLIKDLRSMHGTRVDDRELTPGEQRAILSGSALQFGSSVIRGNATYKPARYTFYADPVNPTHASANTMAASAAVPQSQAFSDTKKGYGDDSSLYSDELDYEEDEDDMSDHDAVDVTLHPDTYSSERDSEISRDDSLQSSGDDSTDEFGEYDGRSMENCCSTDSACLATDAAETGSRSPVKEQSSFCSSYLRESSMLGEGTSSVQPAGPATDFDSEMAGGEWPDYSEADQSTFLTSTSAPWTSETAENFNWGMETVEHMSAKRLKARPFSNSINDLCEPAPKTEATFGEATSSEGTSSESTSSEAAAGEGTTTGATNEVVDVGTVSETPACAASDAERVMADIISLVDDATISTGLAEGSKVEPTGTKRSADEAQLDVEPTTEPTTAVKADQIATPEQMSSRRVAGFTRRARDIGIGAVVGGVAMLTVLVRMGDPA
ncbi:hypothetical protein SLS58_000887 [Diplodia intermedia]|uniref:FHA domain-containing protein n=1 Tax=Diplodia intermedia TaxID=856260 RepID=A0ABR3U4C9_9PEZI